VKLEQVSQDVMAAVLQVDASKEPFRGYQPGVGPYSEPQLVKRIAAYLNSRPAYKGLVQTQRTPDLLIRGHWAIEFKITRPFGDNGEEAENWSVNLLHPYPGNVSTISDSLKLLELDSEERKAVIVIGYEHVPAKIDLTPLVQSFETISAHVTHIRLSSRIELRQDGLVHPVHQAARLFAWEVLPSAA